MSVAAVVLAAGMSTRMGTNKLLQEIDGEPLIRRVARVVAVSAVDPVVVVLGHQALEVGHALTDLRCDTIFNGNYHEGLSSSIRAGINCLPDDCSGALIALGDMPLLCSVLIDRMLASFEAARENAICVATHRGQRGNPALFGRRYFPALLKLEGDVGARHLILENATHVCEIETANDGPLIDIDTPEALTAFRARHS